MPTKRAEKPIQRVIRHQRLSQSRLAWALGINESLMSHYIAGRRVPPDDFYPRAAAYLGVEIKAILPDESAEEAATLAA